MHMGRHTCRQNTRENNNTDKDVLPLSRPCQSLFVAQACALLSTSLSGCCTYPSLPSNLRLPSLFHHLQYTFCYIFELLAPLLTSRIRGGRGSVPSRQPRQLGAGMGAAFGGLGEERVGAGEVAQVEHGVVAAGRPGPRWAGARAAGRESRRPSSRLPALGSGTRVGGPRRPGSPAPASGGGSWFLQSATGLPQPTVPPLI